MMVVLAQRVSSFVGKQRMRRLILSSWAVSAVRATKNNNFPSPLPSSTNSNSRATTSNTSLPAAFSTTTTNHDNNHALETLKMFAKRLEAMQSLKKKSSATIVERKTLKELAESIFTSYQRLPTTRQQDSYRKDIVSFLALDCGSVHVQDAVEHCLAIVKETSSPEHDARLSHALARLRHACTPPFESILRYLLEQDAKQGMVFLMALRDDLRYTIKQSSESTTVNLKELDASLLSIFQTWFVPGMLSIQRISYDTTPASIIEQIARNEAVHPMRNLDDLRQRLGPDRRVFGLFHPLLPNQPLVVLHVALLQEIPSCMDQVHTFSSASSASRVAVFYSISNLQTSLSGVGLGEYLIKRAVESLQQQEMLLDLDTFVTLSPLPTFRIWLEERVAHMSGKFASTDLLDDGRVKQLASALDCDESVALQVLVQQLADRGPNDYSLDTPVVANVMTHLAARYLCREKHRRKPLDGVTRFHVGNGATVYRINWNADRSNKGWKNSFGIMVNYRYELDVLTENQARYESTFDIPMSTEVTDMLVNINSNA